MPLRVAVLFSGGKDSTFAVWHCREKGFEVKYLITMEPKSKESYMFHYPNIKWTRLQAESMGIKQHMHYTSGEKESELSDLISALRPIRHDIDAIAAGGLASTYQVDRIGKVAHGLGLKPVVPFWHMEMEKYWNLLLAAGFEIIIISVSANGLDKTWLGRTVDRQALKELTALSKKFRFHLGFEGGEAETFVTNCPIFKKKIEIIKARKEWHGDNGVYIIEDARLVGK